MKNSTSKRIQEVILENGAVFHADFDHKYIRASELASELVSAAEAEGKRAFRFIEVIKYKSVKKFAEYISKQSGKPANFKDADGVWWMDPILAVEVAGHASDDFKYQLYKAFVEGRLLSHRFDSVEAYKRMVISIANAKGYPGSNYFAAKNFAEEEAKMVSKAINKHFNVPSVKSGLMKAEDHANRVCALDAVRKSVEMFDHAPVIGEVEYILAILG